MAQLCTPRAGVRRRSLPLLERVKFGGIMGILYDQFAMKRVGGLKRKIEKKKKTVPRRAHPGRRTASLPAGVTRTGPNRCQGGERRAAREVFIEVISRQSQDRESNHAQ